MNSTYINRTRIFTAIIRFLIVALRYMMNARQLSQNNRPGAAGLYVEDAREQITWAAGCYLWCKTAK